MKERPILFSGPMVRTLLDGTKTQTRRVIKPQPGSRFGLLPNATRNYWTDSGRVVHCPYGQPGDRLWVRETFAWLVNDDDIPVEPETFLYAATDNYEGRSIPSIHMPRRASRITLEVTDVHVDRGPVSEEDALAEGVTRVAGDLFGVAGIVPFEHHYPQDAFTALFEAINGPGSIDKWRWAVSFKMSERAGTERTC